ncbi:uncharacterized protein LAESUDRAFT_754949 [Laetiporus sulphureus 93-53]|uniref:Uncharacterized protein n=1 Tax=Laetiporus sulphureus 93-53 TaxID=1314785 RepID=A0A165H5T3_9APHY|nr:uncharacterized protein LAESUDRAFT_754949 [Laetiporus sulphureus 93-53]KZT11282.1 hypothetical protein LAESUDRAFT_754949 [Laetiporus sulphureus 93-53]
MSHVDGVFSLAAHAHNLVSTSPAPDAPEVIWQTWATAFSAYESRLVRDHPTCATSLSFEANSIYDWLMLNASPDFHWVKGLVPPTFVGYAPFHEAVGLRRTPAELSEIMQEIVTSADRGDFDNLSEGRIYACNRFLVAYIEGDLFVDRRDQAYLGRTRPIENWWAEHDLKHIPPPSAASVVIAEILQGVVKREAEVVAVPSKVLSRSASIASVVSSVVTAKSTESDTLHEYYSTVHALPKHVQIVFVPGLVLQMPDGRQLHYHALREWWAGLCLLPSVAPQVLVRSIALHYSMSDPATPSSSLCPATPVTSPRKATDLKDAIMGIVYATWEALREAEPLDPSVDLEFLIR